ADGAIQGIWSFELKLNLVQRYLISPAYALEEGRPVRGQNKNLVSPEVHRFVFRDVYRQGKSRFESIEEGRVARTTVYDGGVGRMWNPRYRECIVDDPPIQMVTDGIDYLGTYRNIFGNLSLISCLRERTNVRIVEDGSRQGQIVLETLPLPAKTAVAAFSMGFRVSLDPMKGFMPTRFEHLEELGGRLVLCSSVTVTRWQQLKNGAYAPTRAIFRSYDREPERGTFENLYCEAELSVEPGGSSWNIDIPDKEFELPLPRGTTVIDQVNKVHYVLGSPDPGKNLRELASDARDQMPITVRPKESETGESIPVWLTFSVVCGCLMGIGL